MMMKIESDPEVVPLLKEVLPTPGPSWHVENIHTPISSDVSSIKQENEEAINTELRILKESRIEEQLPTFPEVKRVQKTAFTCDICKKTFSRKRAIREHMPRVHKTIKCHFCPQTFGDKNTRDKHIVLTHLEKKFECEVCHKKFACGKYLLRHMDSHENERLALLSKTRDDVVVYTCGTCGKEYYNAYILKRHQTQTHNYRKPKVKRETFRCETCLQEFYTMKLLMSHKRVHEYQSFDCDICGKKFPHKDYLRRHIEAHAVERKYVCKLCPKRYNLSHRLSRHMRTHDPSKKREPVKEKNAVDLNNLTIFECEICEKQYSSQAHLKQHLLIHTGKKRHQCSFCKKMFLYKHDLTVHVRTHTGEKPFACSKCNNKYAAVSNLRLHERKIHNIYARKLKQSAD